jgi:hypothetical protein
LARKENGLWSNVQKASLTSPRDNPFSGASMSEIRASYGKLALRHLRDGPEEERRAVWEAAGREELSAIRGAGVFTFLPAWFHVRLADATIDALGPTRSRAFWRDVMLSAFDRRLLSPLVRGALRIYGRSPASIMRMTPQAWSLVWRDCGRVWMDHGKASKRATMRFDGMPTELSQSAGVLQSFMANCDAAIAYLGCKGTVIPDFTKARSGVLSIDVEWTAAQELQRPTGSVG